MGRAEESMMIPITQEVLHIQQMTHHANRVAEIGSTRITKTIHSMKKISDRVRRIERAIQMIDNIAAQSNLLAMNTATQASKAGEFGYGIAVIAEEVHRLAKLSAKAVIDIRKHIDESHMKYEEGVDVVGNTEDVLKQIAQQVTQITSHIDQLTITIHEQNLILQDSQRVQETAKALAQVSSELMSLMLRFKV